MGRAFGRSGTVIGTVRGIGRAIGETLVEEGSGRVTTHADITGMTTFLASKDSDHVTGQIVMIDGGMAPV